ncbi:MAG: hypothetical protein ACR2P1_05755, partial [Pseudomonadales bacterium]
MGIETGNTTNASQQYAYGEDMPSKHDLLEKPMATEAESTKSDWRDVNEIVDNPLSSLVKRKAVDFSGEIKDISSSADDVKPGQPYNPQDAREIKIELDSGLKATVDEDGIKFDQLNTGEGTIAAWYSMPVGELDFSELENSSIGPGEGGFASRLADPDANVDFETQKAAVALYDSLQSVDKSELSDAQSA